MNNIKTEFSIKDLENLSGIKAHTIRIWEKRYNLLEPHRTDTNIRYYSTENLQKLLNIAFLNNNGYKISKISNLKSHEIPLEVKKIAFKNAMDGYALNAFKLSMMTFDPYLFSKTYNELIAEKSFKEVFYDAFLPLLTDIGLLWQTDTITPAHEHFISTRIEQKILLNIETLQEDKAFNKSKKTFVFYLPINEIHDIGLLFTNYELIIRGYQTLFLGQSVPIECLQDLMKFYENITFVSYFTIKPEKEDIQNYLNLFSETLLTNNKNELWILGNMANNLDTINIPKHITKYSSIADLVKNL
ncbi:MerR family transcriptional regulator [Yeosuana sp.]|uniref:MerR family transcriptional regulator n=1 Tax=Yeosuana sp. TaxID=2529388 RepID=UPI004054D5AE|tara:strand:+ start:176 stop:1078 length:903 start_codon:yes stop_codon:yes gene_type:complete